MSATTPPRCLRCGHRPHIARQCYNMASDGDCGCEYGVSLVDRRSATTPPPRPPGERILTEEALDIQYLYREYLDAWADPNDDGQEAVLDGFIDKCLDLLERITGESVPPSTIHPDSMDDADYRGEH